MDANETTSQCDESLVEVVSPFVTQFEAAILVQPTLSPFHHPPVDPQTTAVGPVAAGDVRPDASLLECSAVGIRIVSAVGKEGSGPLVRMAHFPFGQGHMIHQVQQFGHVVPVGRRGRERQGHAALPVHQQVVFGAVFPAVHHPHVQVYPMNQSISFFVKRNLMSSSPPPPR
jgi:hypothetical protein